MLSNDDVEQLFDIQACLDALEQAYIAQASGGTVTRARTQSYVPLNEPGVQYCLKSMEGALVAGGYMALRITSDIISELPVNGVPRREKLARGPGGTYCGLIILFSIKELAPVAIMHDGYIQLQRVACTSALSARLLARHDAGDLGLLGSSGQAWTHLVAMNAVRKLRRVRVFSPSPERREIFAERARRELALDVAAVDSPHAAVDGADIVVAATNTSQSIIDGAWLAPGTHVISIVSGDQTTRRRELDNETLRRAAVVIAHSRQVARTLNQGDLSEPVAAGVLSWDQIFDLSELIAGGAPGRSSPEDITVFKNNVGLGLQFAAVAPMIYRRARNAGIGRELPGEWFLQRLKP
jgi:ornithine cyclodeaminase/alanine dehydrogenase-like protein (mu-crystallin family)